MYGMMPPTCFDHRFYVLNLSDDDASPNAQLLHHPKEPELGLLGNVSCRLCLSNPTGSMKSRGPIVDVYSDIDGEGRVYQVACLHSYKLITSREFRLRAKWWFLSAPPKNP